MNIGATLFGQMITFAIFVWFTMKFVWPMLETTLEERKKKIADGLAAAEKGHKTLENAEDFAKKQVNQTKEKTHQMIEQAGKQAAQIIEDAKQAALKERDTILASGHAQIEQAVHQAKSELQQQVAQLVVQGTEKILDRSINVEDHQSVLQQISKKLA